MSRNKEKETETAEEAIPPNGEETAGSAEQTESKAEADPKDQEIAKLKDQLMRNIAEYDNYRKRTAKERTELTPEITARIVTEFLPVMDNLERALQTECTDENYKKGVEMIRDAFSETLEKLGVERVPTEDFDPSIHQAVQQVESEELESGKIASVFQNGYRIGTRVIRFAMVAVVS